MLAGSLVFGLVPLSASARTLSCISWMLQKYWLRGSVQVGQLEGHATDATIADGTVPREDKEGNDAADIAAEFGRLRQPEMVIC